MKPPQKHSNQSLIIRLALMFALSAALLLTALGSTTYWLLNREFRRDETRVLGDTIALLEMILHQNQGLVETLQREIPVDLEAIHFNRYQLKVLDSHGSGLYETRHFPTLSQEFFYQIPVYKAGILGKAAFWQQADISFLIVKAWVKPDDPHQDKICLLVALDTSQKTKTLKNYRQILIFLMGLGVTLAALLAGLISYQGLQPLSVMTTMVQHLKLDQLHQRFCSHKWPKELVPLAQEFDRLLDEIQIGVERLSHFSTDLAHELRTPLTSLMLQAEVTLAQERSPQIYQEVLGSSIEELEHLSILVERLLLLARTEAARSHLELQTLTLLPTVNNLVEYYLSALASDQVIIEIPEQAQIIADHSLLELALGNLLSNAAKYSTLPIHIQWQEYPDEWVITIRDQGPGIAPAHLPYLFDRLYRVDTARTSISHGLGLALVRSAMKAQGGEVTLQSTAGGSSSFQLHFPRPKANTTSHSKA